MSDSTEADPMRKGFGTSEFWHATVVSLLVAAGAAAGKVETWQELATAIGLVVLSASYALGRSALKTAYVWASSRWPQPKAAK